MPLLIRCDDDNRWQPQPKQRQAIIIVTTHPLLQCPVYCDTSSRSSQPSIVRRLSTCAFFFRHKQHEQSFVGAGKHTHTHTAAPRMLYNQQPERTYANRKNCKIKSADARQVCHKTHSYKRTVECFAAAQLPADAEPPSVCVVASVQ